VSKLELFFDRGGQRHFLDGSAVHCGNVLELQGRDGAWIPGRYEASTRGDPPVLRAVFFTSFAHEPIILNSLSELRWPLEVRR
jgi:hypothetical protein